MHLFKGMGDDQTLPSCQHFLGKAGVALKGMYSCSSLDEATDLV
jgi:hypothetical protein